MRNWDRLVDEYLEQCQARGLSAETLGNLRRELDRCGCWLKNRRPRPELIEVRSELLIGYLRMRGAYRAKATLAGSMSVLRRWGEFLVEKKVWADNPLRWMKGPKLSMYSRVPRRISRTVLQDLWDKAAKGRLKYHRYLWLAALSLLYGTGLRRGELTRLNVADWCSQEGTLRIDGRKTGRPRQVAVPELTFRCVETYLMYRQNHLESLGLPPASEPALLVNKDGARVTGFSLSRALQQLARHAGADNFTLHQFRHTCASDLLEKGTHLPEVQRLLGHQCIATTMRYLHIADPERHKAANLHPINQILAARPEVANQITSMGEQS